MLARVGYGLAAIRGLADLINVL